MDCATRVVCYTPVEFVNDVNLRRADGFRPVSDWS